MLVGVYSLTFQMLNVTENEKKIQISHSCLMVLGKPVQSFIIYSCKIGKWILQTTFLNTPFIQQKV